MTVASNITFHLDRLRIVTDPSVPAERQNLMAIGSIANEVYLGGEKISLHLVFNKN